MLAVLCTLGIVVHMLIAVDVELLVGNGQVLLVFLLLLSQASLLCRQTVHHFVRV